MSSIKPTREPTKTQAHGQAQLFYLIGPSGAGKDSLINWLKQQPQAIANAIYFAPRYISRPTDNGIEQHIYLDADGFGQQRHQFAMYWQANGYHYGIHQEVLVRLQQGQSVVINGSRAELAQAQQVFGERLKVVLLSVCDATLAQRLQQRGRETSQQITARLTRHHRYQDVNADAIIDNNHSLEDAGKQLLKYIEGIIAKDTEPQHQQSAPLFASSDIP